VASGGPHRQVRHGPGEIIYKCFYFRINTKQTCTNMTRK